MKFRNADRTTMAPSLVAEKQKRFNRREGARKAVSTRFDNAHPVIPAGVPTDIEMYVRAFDAANSLKPGDYWGLSKMKAYPYYVERDLGVEHDA